MRFQNLFMLLAGIWLTGFAVKLMYTHIFYAPLWVTFHPINFIIDYIPALIFGIGSIVFAWHAYYQRRFTTW